MLGRGDLNRHLPLPFFMSDNRLLRLVQKKVRFRQFPIQPKTGKGTV